MGGRPASIALLAAVLIVTATSALAAATSVSIRADDGVLLSATWQPPSQPAPAVLLVHSFLRSHADWDPVAGRLHDAGFGVLALDLRGHGRSGGSISPDVFQPFVRDVKAALAWLEKQPLVLAAHLGIGGLSLGATLAVVAAGADPAVRSVALISPAAEFRGLRALAAMRSFAGRSGAAFLVAGELDPYGSRTARQFAEVTPGLRDLRIEEGIAANGRALLQARPDLQGALVDWFRRTLL
jgi:alpha-beta hydrolase superfamily lysophospholipase